MKKHAILAAVIMAMLALGFDSVAQADTFGSGADQFTIDFVPISGATNPTSGYGIVNHDYRMGTYEVTNDQWNKFVAAYGTVTGSQGGYGFSSYFTGANQPTESDSWFEAAQFVNWLNTSTGHQAAYKFIGTPHTGDYTFVDWSAGDAGYDAASPYRNQNAYYFLPNEDEWVKAAYWNGTTLQTYATVGDVFPAQGHGTDTGWNYYDIGYATNPYGPWTVGSGSQELNGTYDMMGNNWEWVESPYDDPAYGAGSWRGARSGIWGSIYYYLQSSYRAGFGPAHETYGLGFRVASVPEPGSIILLVCAAAAGLLWWKRRK